jgi:hypothetical protein
MEVAQVAAITKTVTAVFPGVGQVKIVRTYDSSTGKTETKKRVLPPKSLKIPADRR